MKYFLLMTFVFFAACTTGSNAETADDSTPKIDGELGDRCGNKTNVRCPKHSLCAAQDDGTGRCIKEPRAQVDETCGTIAGIRCDESLICARPSGFDQKGICVSSDAGEACAGFEGLSCPEGKTCHSDGAIDDGPGVCLSTVG